MSASQSHSCCQEILYPETIEEVYARLAEAARLKAILEE
jgi:hypothetical protein